METGAQYFKCICVNKMMKHHFMKTFLVFICFIAVNGYAQDYRDNCLDSLNIPSLYTIKEDNTIDLFRIEFACPPEEFEYAIYNRWGSLIYKTDDAKFIWSGENEDGDPVQEGDYFWVLKYTFNGSNVSKTGSLKVELEQ